MDPSSSCISLSHIADVGKVLMHNTECCQYNSPGVGVGWGRGLGAWGHNGTSLIMYSLNRPAERQLFKPDMIPEVCLR